MQHNITCRPGVILAYAGIHNTVRNRLMDSRLRGNDAYSGQPCAYAGMTFILDSSTALRELWLKGPGSILAQAN